MMHSVGDLVVWLEQFAPLELAESWDNVGLLLGDRNIPVSRVMTCLTVTPDTAKEAIIRDARLIVSHHPILFKPVQRITAQSSAASALVWDLARAGVAVYSPHTAFDNCVGGINELLAARLGLKDVGALVAVPRGEMKVVVFCGRADRGKVLDAVFAAGAGRIGAYSECSFSSPGVGTFHGDETTNPAVGVRLKREMAREWRVEFVCPEGVIEDVLAAIRGAHSYEEPAVDVYPLRPRAGGPGRGRIGSLLKAEALERFVRRVEKALPGAGVRAAGDPEREVRRVAIVCGAGDSFLGDAARQGADVLLTGEARYHAGIEAEGRGIGLVVAGHHATERPGVEQLAERIGEAFPALEVWACDSEADPFW